jgi:hypothetical protein
MSLYVGATASDYGLKTSGLIDHNSAYTWMAWVDLVSDTDNYGHIWAALGDNFDYYGNADWVGTKSDGVGARLACYNGGSSGEIYGYDLVVGTPTHLAVVRESATSLKLYQDGSYVNSVGVNVSTRTSTQREQLGELYGYPAPARMTAMKQWQAALTADEIVAEMKTVRPLRLANLHSWHPAIASDKATALKDFSGNGRDWTEQGTLSVASESPPVGWGGRTVIVLPVTGPAPQLLAPVSDVSAGGWTASSGSDLYAMLDESAYNDADYIVSSTASACTLAFAAGSDPGVSTGHVLRYRLLAGSGSVTAKLKQGTTTIATFGPHTLTGAAQDFAQTLSAGQADSITDYSALRVEFTAS